MKNLRFMGMVLALVVGHWGNAEEKAAQPVKVLILSGQNNHHWQRTTGLLEEILKPCPLFETRTLFSPASGAAASAWMDWDPHFDQYDVILNNYYGDNWPESVRSGFIEYVRHGGTVLNIHAANNAFNGWNEYEQMVGLLWRSHSDGWGMRLNDQDEKLMLPPGEGPGAGHGGLHDWVIQTRDADNPIFMGLPARWLHAHDELYHGQRGPARNINLLATAYSSRESGGTGFHEPQIWWIPFGQGKVLTFLPGHIWPGQRDDSAFRCVGFQTVLIRSLEWLATGQVTYPVPDDFPTSESTSVRAPQ
ncbi:MAG: ThuA domain-containing protein [Verrucomicrobia bacterium]|nr:ThuA domain-containing protein [Verrucomicrobiota bacterium]